LALTFKIEQISGACRLIIRRIGEPDAECLPKPEAQIASDGCNVVLDMDEVTLVNVEVVRFLISCEAHSIQLRGCSPYIREWIRRKQENDQ
jgi:hypothetical protein